MVIANGWVKSVVEPLTIGKRAGRPRANRQYRCQVIGGELDPGEIVGDGLRAACVSYHGLAGCLWSCPLGRHAQPT
jgi:hypothetical protein